MTKDYYKTLGVDKSASQEDLKKAFRKLAHQYHPDKKGGDEAKFKEVNEAYQVLSDEKKRANYDRFGSADGPTGGGFGGGQNYGGFQGGFQGDFDFGNINDIFSEFFGDNRGFNGGGEAKPRGRDLSTEIKITFEESVFGVKKRIAVNKMATCNTCQGSGAKAGTALKQCPTCGGRGKIQEMRNSMFGSFASVRQCPTCHGVGKIPEEKCTHCKGSGVHKKEVEFEISVPAGINNDETLRLSGGGEAVAHGIAGDLYIKISVTPHSTFKRVGNDLVMDIQIKLSDALLGAEYNIKTLDGTIALKIPEGVTHGEILRIRGKGVPTRNGRGDMLVTVKIVMPKKLSKSAKHVVEELKKEGL
ncbi:MAG: molecular chaperone DnaJ [Candidatus Pacebacteria bacterium]|jgi:molecular chaperone DnaJ|nr:molecular chaperone DnaJ [Candidatus Paceibacterota bacterium]